MHATINIDSSSPIATTIFGSKHPRDDSWVAPFEEAESVKEVLVTTTSAAISIYSLVLLAEVVVRLRVSVASSVLFDPAYCPINERFTT